MEAGGTCEEPVRNCGSEVEREQAWDAERSGHATWYIDLRPCPATTTAAAVKIQGRAAVQHCTGGVESKV